MTKKKNSATPTSLQLNDDISIPTHSRATVPWADLALCAPTTASCVDVPVRARAINGALATLDVEAPRLSGALRGHILTLVAAQRAVEGQGSSALVYVLDAVRLLGVSRDTIDARIKACPDRWKPKFTAGPTGSRRRYYWNSPDECKRWWNATARFMDPDFERETEPEPEPGSPGGQALANEDFRGLEDELTRD